MQGGGRGQRLSVLLDDDMKKQQESEKTDDHLNLNLRFCLSTDHIEGGYF